MDFLKFSTAPTACWRQASWISYGPARKSSSPLVGSYHGKPDLKMGPQMPTAPRTSRTRSRTISSSGPIIRTS